jgi:hypothetical protein
MISFDLFLTRFFHNRSNLCDAMGFTAAVIFAALAH